MMRFIQIAGALCCAIALSGASCAHFGAPVVAPPPPPRLDQPDTRLTELCNDPVVIAGKGALTQETLEGLWGQDTDSLIACKEKNRILICFYAFRDAGLTGKAAAKRCTRKKI